MSIRKKNQIIRKWAEQQAAYVEYQSPSWRRQVAYWLCRARRELAHG